MSKVRPRVDLYQKMRLWFEALVLAVLYLNEMSLLPRQIFQ